MMEPHAMDHFALAYTILAAICRSSVYVRCHNQNAVHGWSQG